MLVVLVKVGGGLRFREESDRGDLFLDSYLLWPWKLKIVRSSFARPISSYPAGSVCLC